MTDEQSVLLYLVSGEYFCVFVIYCYTTEYPKAYHFTQSEEEWSLMVVMGQEFLSSSAELRLQAVCWVGPVVTSWSGVSYSHSWQMGAC